MKCRLLAGCLLVSLLSCRGTPPANAPAPVSGGVPTEADGPPADYDEKRIERSTGNSAPPHWVYGPLPEATDEEMYYHGSKTDARTLEDGERAARDIARQQCLEAVRLPGEVVARGFKQDSKYHELVEYLKNGRVVRTTYNVHVLSRYSPTDPRDRAPLLYIKGQREVEHGDLEKAIGLFEQALALDPVFANCCYSLAKAYDKHAVDFPQSCRAYQRKTVEAYAQFLTLESASPVAPADLARVKAALSSGLREDARKHVAERHFEEAVQELLEAHQLATDGPARETLYSEYYSAAGKNVLLQMEIESRAAAWSEKLPAGDSVQVGVMPFVTSDGERFADGDALQQAVVTELARLKRVEVLRLSAEADPPENLRAKIYGHVNGQNTLVETHDGRNDAVLASSPNVVRLRAGGGETPSGQEKGFGDLRLELETAVLTQRRAGAQIAEGALADGAALKSGDQFQVHFKVNRDAFVYVVNFDSGGQALALFPSTEIKLANNVKGGAWYAMPDGNRWFVLDNHAGTETLYVVASVRPMEDIAAQLAKIDKPGADPAGAVGRALIERLNVRSRGVSGIRPSVKRTFTFESGHSVEISPELTKGRGSAARIIKFEHQ